MLCCKPWTGYLPLPSKTESSWCFHLHFVWQEGNQGCLHTVPTLLPGTRVAINGIEVMIHIDKMGNVAFFPENNWGVPYKGGCFHFKKCQLSLKPLHKALILINFSQSHKRIASDSSAVINLLDGIYEEEVVVGMVQHRIKPGTPAFSCWVW